MSTERLLKDKHILAVDDEPDFLESIAAELDMCIVDKAMDHDTALQYLQNYIYDIVILDIMGVRGFDLLKESVSKGFPTVVLTAHSLSLESLKKSMKLGAVSYFPKENLPDLRSHLEEIVLGGGRPLWKKLFDRMGSYFSRRFGPDWREKDEFFKEFEEQRKQSAGDHA